SISLQADGAAAGNLSVNALVQTISGAITLRADNNVTFTANGDVTSATGNVTVNADDDNSGMAGGLLTMADGALINAGSGTITLTSDGDVTLGGLQTTNATTTAVQVTSREGGIVDGGDSDIDIIANAAGSLVTLNAETGIGHGNALETTAARLAATNSGSGNIQIIETDGIQLSAVQQTSAIATSNIEVVSITGLLDVLSGGAGIGAFGSGSISLQADGAAAGNLSVNALVQTISGAITLRADNNVTFTANGDVASGSGNVTVNADDDNSGVAGGLLTMADGALINAGSGTITLTSDGDVTLGGLQTTNATATAVQVTSREGGIIDGGDSDIDIIANAAGSLVTLNAETGIGHGSVLETTLRSLDAVNQGIGVTGDISISESDGLTIRRVRQEATGGAIGISVAAGGLTVASGHAGVTSSGHGNIELSSGGLADLQILSNVSTYGGDIIVRSGGDVRVGDFAGARGATISTSGAATMLTAGGAIAGSVTVNVSSAAGFSSGQEVEIIEGSVTEVTKISTAAGAVDLVAGKVTLTAALTNTFTKAARIVARQESATTSLGAAPGSMSLQLNDVSAFVAEMPVEIRTGGAIQSLVVDSVNTTTKTVTLKQPLPTALAAGTRVFAADTQKLSVRADAAVYLAEGVLLTTDDLSAGSVSSLRGDLLEVRADADGTFLATGVRSGLLRTGELLQLRTDGGVAARLANRPRLDDVQTANTPNAFFVDQKDPLLSNIGTGEGFNYVVTFNVAIPTVGEENLRLDIDWRDSTSDTGGIQSRYLSYQDGGVPQTVDYTYSLADFVVFINNSKKEFTVDFSVGHHETIRVTADTVHQEGVPQFLLGDAALKSLDERGVSTTDQGPVQAGMLGTSLTTVPVGKDRGVIVIDDVDSNNDYHFEGGTVLVKIPTPPFQPIVTPPPIKPLPQFQAEQFVSVIQPQSVIEVLVEESVLLEAPSPRSEDRYELRQLQSGAEKVVLREVEQGDRLLSPEYLRRWVNESELEGNDYELWLVTRKRTNSGADVLIERKLLEFDVTNRQPFPSADAVQPAEVLQPQLVPVEGPIPGMEGTHAPPAAPGEPGPQSNLGPDSPTLEAAVEQTVGSLIQAPGVPEPAAAEPVDRSEEPQDADRQVSWQGSNRAGRLATTVGIAGLFVSQAVRQGPELRNPRISVFVSQVLRQVRGR
ncbi:MAG: beta strand repeat-containing protein, partial [Planctomyces sp.]